MRPTINRLHLQKIVYIINIVEMVSTKYPLCVVIINFIRHLRALSKHDNHILQWSAAFDTDRFVRAEFSNMKLFDCKL